MRAVLIAVVAVVLLILNGFLFWQNRVLKQAASAGDEENTVYLVDVEGQQVDLRGLYTYPGIGAMFLPRDSMGEAHTGSMNLVVFLSAKTTCGLSLSEAKNLRRLHAVMTERNQTMVAVAVKNDSTAVQEFLDKEALEIPLLLTDSLSGYSLEQWGISPRFMPFKILYDSTATAIYMSGANNTPESQQGFERAVLKLSSLAANGGI